MKLYAGEGELSHGENFKQEGNTCADHAREEEFICGERGIVFVWSSARGRVTSDKSLE